MDILYTKMIFLSLYMKFNNGIVISMKGVTMAKFKRQITAADRQFVKDVSTRLRELRQELGLTILELSEQSSVPFNTIARYEHGSPTFSQLRYFADMAKVFGVSLDYLAGLEEEDE